MVHFMKPWEVVKGMSAARQRGHGCVWEYLEAVRVARSTAYRWDQELAWRVEYGPSELRRLRRECEELAATVARAAAGQAGGPALSAERERAFLLHAVVLGASDTEAAILLKRAGGRTLSHQTVHEVVAAAEVAARGAFERYFQGVGRVGAADEIFLGRQPLLLVVEPRSLLLFGLHLAEGRGAEDWKPLLAAMTQMERCASDAARGLTKAADERGFSRQFDMRHGLTKGRARLARRVSQTLAWRSHDKDPVSLLRAASTGSLADETEIAIIELVDEAVRSSSSVECVNSRVRLVQVARKRLSEGFIYLLAVYHNLRTFGRGSVREGKSAAELAGIELPTNDWIELLDLAAKPKAQAKANAA